MRRRSTWALALVLVLGCDRPSRDVVVAYGPPIQSGLQARIESATQAVRRIVTHESTSAARVTLGERSHAPTTITDSMTGLSAQYAPRFGHEVAAISRDSMSVMTDVAPQVDLVRRARLDGVEEYAIVAQPIAGDALEWDVTIGDGVAGLRLVENVLELLDGAGAPRLRVPAPFIVDARGMRRSAVLDVRGAAVDRSPIAPFHRAIVAPGARTFGLSVRWDARDLAYPIVVDPAWTTTTSMATARAGFALTTLDDGRLLAAGGGDGVELAATEVFDPTTSTWAVTGALNIGRAGYAASTLTDGTVAVFGGAEAVSRATGDPSTAERFDPTTGAWTAMPAMLASHTAPTATRLPNGDVLIVGGEILGGLCERFVATSGASGAFVAEPAMPHPRMTHGAALVGGRVIVAGGYDSSAGGVPLSDEYDVGTSSWLPSLAMLGPHRKGVVVGIGAAVFVVGGLDASLTASTLVEQRTSVTDAWSAAPSLLVARNGHVAVPTTDGALLVAGDVADSSTERFP
ncbi:MAG: Kelch repeat-containing protein, partial [Polyangiales bacterium]